jgi:hypothetical protein
MRDDIAGICFFALRGECTEEPVWEGEMGGLSPHLHGVSFLRRDVMHAAQKVASIASHLFALLEDRLRIFAIRLDFKHASRH